MFLSSPVSKQFERGEVSVLVGKSGVELALMVSGKEKEYAKPFFFGRKKRRILDRLGGSILPVKNLPLIFTD